MAKAKTHKLGRNPGSFGTKRSGNATLVTGADSPRFLSGSTPQKQQESSLRKLLRSL